MIGDLTHFDVVDIRQAKNALGLQLQLARVQSPEALAETSLITANNFGNPAINCTDVAAIVEVELHPCVKSVLYQSSLYGLAQV
jgi:hypothetical protein